MTKFLIGCALSLTMVAQAAAQTSPSPEEAGVQQVLTRLFDAISAVDMEALKQCTTKDILLLESGAVWNIDSITQKMGAMKGLGNTRINHLEFVRTEISGNLAWVAYHNAADITANGQTRTIKWLESAVLSKEDGAWKVKMLHSTRLGSK
jgi:ketosteroid isomerase-like protein